MAQELAFDQHHVDDLYLSLLFDETEILPVSDAKYAEELHFQEFLMGSVITSQSTTNGSSSSLSLLPMAIQVSPMLTIAEPVDETEKVVGESSQILCEICVERKESDEMFRSPSCYHSFCSDCITKYVAAKIQDNIYLVTCPGFGCKGELELETCRPMLPKEVLDRWDEARCEALILASQKFYCPFRDCSAMLVNDDGGQMIRESECPICHRLFCAQCYVPWHPGVECEEFQRLNEYERGREDLMVRELAREKKWGRCPHCKFFVEKTQGCLHMTCRCKFQFCYGCSSGWTATHTCPSE